MHFAFLTVHFVCLFVEQIFCKYLSQLLANETFKKHKVLNDHKLWQTLSLNCMTHYGTFAHAHVCVVLCCYAKTFINFALQIKCRKKANLLIVMAIEMRENSAFARSFLFT